MRFPSGAPRSGTPSDVAGKAGGVANLGGLPSTTEGQKRIRAAPSSDLVLLEKTSAVCCFGLSTPTSILTL